MNKSCSFHKTISVADNRDGFLTFSLNLKSLLMQKTNLPIKKSRFNLVKSILLGLIIQISTLFSAHAVTPVVTGIYPATGEINGFFSLLGSNFNDVEFVYFNDNNGGIDFTTAGAFPNFLELNFPSSIRNGVLTLTGTFGSYVTSIPFTLATPNITSITPVASNGRISILGSNMRGIDKVNFTSSDGNAASSNFPINFGDYIRVNFIPSNAALGVITLTGGFGTVISTINFTPAIPTVTGIYPTEGLIDGYLTLLGTNLDGVQSIMFKNTVGNIVTDVVNTSTNKIVHAPYFISTGAITLTGGFGTKISEFSFQTPTPSITGIFPATGVADDGTLTLLGNNMEGISTVKFKTTTGIFSTSFITSNSNSVIISFVDRTVSNGVITVSGGFGEFATSLNFVVPMPTVTGINPQTGFTGNGFLTLTGQNFYFVDNVRFVGLGFSGIYNAQPNPRTNSTLVITDHPNIISGEISLVGTNFGVIKTGIQYTDVVLPPSITGIYPTVGVDENGDISLLGQNLTSLQTIRFVSSLTDFVSTNNFTLEGFAKIRVPADAITGEISITGIGLSGLTATNIRFIRTTVPGIVPSVPGINTTVVSVSGIQSSVSLENIVNQVFITLTGSGFVNGTSVTIGGVVLSNIVVSGNVITGTIPAGAVVANPSNPSIIIQNPGLTPSVGITPVAIEVVTNISFHSTQNNEIEIYPNPSHGEFNIKAPQNSTIQLFNTLGILVKEIYLTNEISKISILQKGVFIVKITSSKGNKTIKINIE
ncbi:MAG: T9SS C-terminal target domain-containing protein [Bacteroidetes bacterium]|nr:MAG: T9SS C-terminal target domain-containing protein [Bacteroidota bacterium]